MTPEARARHDPQYVVVLIDGAPDSQTCKGQTPLEAAHIPHIDRVAKDGVTGLMTSLYPDLPRESLVAQLGILGWDPRKYWPGGRASAEALALGLQLGKNDLAFRANLVRMKGPTLASYSAHHIQNERARELIDLVNSLLGAKFPNFELANSGGFRNSLVIRDANIDPAQLSCPEPHEHQGEDLDIAHIITARAPEAEEAVTLANSYLANAAEVLKGQEANAILLWSPSAPLVLPPFNARHNFGGKCAVVGSMDYLKGVASVGGLEYFACGDGTVNTDYDRKGRTVVGLLENDYRFVYCHINAPDEAAHTGIIEEKIKSLEHIDLHVVKPIVEYFEGNPDRLGGVVVTPDHYANTYSSSAADRGTRKESHILDPVPFASWDGRRRDGVRTFAEKSATAGKYSSPPISHLDLLGLLLDAGERE